MYFDAAKKLDEQQKEIARKQKDDKETMKKLIENVLKQQELILVSPNEFIHVILTIYSILLN